MSLYPVFIKTPYGWLKNPIYGETEKWFLCFDSKKPEIELIMATYLLKHKDHKKEINKVLKLIFDRLPKTEKQTSSYRTFPPFYSNFKKAVSFSIKVEKNFCILPSSIIYILNKKYKYYKNRPEVEGLFFNFSKEN